MKKTERPNEPARPTGDRSTDTCQSTGATTRDSSLFVSKWGAGKGDGGVHA